MVDLLPQEAVKLRSPITLASGSKITITCDYPVRVEVADHNLRCPESRRRQRAASVCMLSAKKPLTLAATEPMRVTSNEPLSTAFAEGWRKLPDESKVRVLAKNLTTRKPIVYDHMWVCDKCRRDFTLCVQLRHHLALGPDVAHLARQVFYERNTFALQYHDMPPLAVRKYIRRISVTEKHMYGHSPILWNILERLAAGTLGFDNLQYLQLHFQPGEWDSSYYGYEYKSATTRSLLHFLCKGTLIIDACPG